MDLVESKLSLSVRQLDALKVTIFFANFPKEAENKGD